MTYLNIILQLQVIDLRHRQTSNYTCGLIRKRLQWGNTQQNNQNFLRENITYKDIL